MAVGSVSPVFVLLRDCTIVGSYADLVKLFSDSEAFIIQYDNMGVGINHHIA